MGLAANSKVLILDEPTDGIQPSIIRGIGRVIRMLARGKGNNLEVDGLRALVTV
jgi:ABC-type branched-subunit amino acid transport system ATPase component